MIRWGLVATVKTPVEKLLAFLAWHLDLGAARISLYFDDPDDPAPEVLAAVPGLAGKVVLTPCDEAHWRRLGGRPERHQNRQAKNARDAYRAAGPDWIGHIDADEFLWAEVPVAQILASLPREQIMCRAEPFEAMHDPALPDDIYTASAFRGALKPRHAALRRPVLGEFAGMLPEGMLSHAAGKAFFRAGIQGLSPRLHGAFIGGERLPGPGFDPRLKLLHFHAQDRAAWAAALPFRLTRGAYQYHPELCAFLSGASPAQIAEFYDETQVLTPAKTAALREAGRLMELRLDLAARVARLTAR
ncbi:glycosyltransferase family 2 protein [Pseudogemmobacter humi]|uniref:Glycosyl transferase family 2 n=1 Tax=Pseudogemmobacter humi TaxID=2483812 RepID=A0A3P5XC87_9RHOB|nr:glycosyltransferase family 2 protein [Pseudogemmobacter humi]VDC26099.1 hypothetical protein XINFAN_01587 [Pseudogemmobacter humi]